MESPGSLLVGIGKGTTSLFQGVVTGAMNSTTAIAETAGTGLSFLSGDADFIRKRAAQRQKINASRSGIIEGIVSEITKNTVFCIYLFASLMVHDPISAGYWY